MSPTPGFFKTLAKISVVVGAALLPLAQIVAAPFDAYLTAIGTIFLTVIPLIAKLPNAEIDELADRAQGGYYPPNNTNTDEKLPTSFNRPDSNG